MVNSKINKTIDYLEVNSVDLNDIDHESDIYLGKLYNKNINFTIGLPIYDYVDFNIIYFYLYLVKKNDVVMKIGIYEINKHIFDDIFAKNQDIDLTKLDPIIFSFVKTYITNEYDDKIVLHKKNQKNIKDSDSDSDSDSESESNIKDNNTDIDDLPIAPKIKLPTQDYSLKKTTIKEQTQEESDAEIFQYQEKTSDKWINKYLQSNKYDIIDNEGGGDCFFAILRDALKNTDLDKYKNLTVKDIRKKLSLEIDEEIFNHYKELNSFYMGGSKSSNKIINEKKKLHSLYKKQIGGARREDIKKELLNGAKNNIKTLNEEIDKQKELKLLTQEFNFMTDINSIDELKNIINTNKYWADIWAISNLERLYNVKFIIFSEEHFNNDEMDNIIRCFDLNKKILDNGIFEPDFYILTSYEQDIHYKLIIYDKNLNKSAFSFLELPYRIKELFIEKCIELTNFRSNYLIIPDINNFIESKDSSQDDIISSKSKITVNKDFEDFIEKSKNKNLEYDENVVIQFYNKSIDKKLGEGTGETILKEYKTLSNILKLNKIKGWRKKLDNNWIVENLYVDGSNFSSVQHYLFALRFNNIKEIFNKFLKDNPHPAGNNLEDAKKLYDTILKDKKSYNYSFINNSEYQDILYKNKKKILYSKFNQNQELLEILLLTKDYKLNLYKPRYGAFLAKNLMKVRNLLQK